MKSVLNNTENMVCENQEHSLCLHEGKKKVLSTQGFLEWCNAMKL